MSLIFDNLKALQAAVSDQAGTLPGRHGNAAGGRRRSRRLDRLGPAIGAVLLAGLMGVGWLVFLMPDPALQPRQVAPGALEPAAPPEPMAAVDPVPAPVPVSLPVPVPVEALPTLAMGAAEAVVPVRSIPAPLAARTPAPARVQRPAEPSGPAQPASLVVSAAPAPALVNRLRSQLILALDQGDAQAHAAALNELRALLGDESLFIQRMEAFVLLRTQAWDAAELAYDALLLGNPDDAEARFNSGWLAMRRGDMDKAERRLRTLQRHPEYRQQVAGLLADLDRHARAGM